MVGFVRLLSYQSQKPQTYHPIRRFELCSFNYWLEKAPLGNISIKYIPKLCGAFHFNVTASVYSVQIIETHRCLRVEVSSPPTQIVALLKPNNGIALFVAVFSTLSLLFAANFLGNMQKLSEILRFNFDGVVSVGKLIPFHPKNKLLCVLTRTECADGIQPLHSKCSVPP